MRKVFYLFMLFYLTSCGVDSLTDSTKSNNDNTPKSSPPNDNKSNNDSDNLHHEQPSLNVSISNIKNSTGNICISIYDNPEGFPDSADTAVFLKCIPLQNWDKNIPVYGLKKDVNYGIAVFHDENRNEDLDKKRIFGDLEIPTEGFGFSRNPGLSKGPPKFEDISFKLESFPDGIVIDLMYPI